MSDEIVRRSQHSQLNSTDVLVIRMHYNEPDAFVHLKALDGRPAVLSFEAYNSIDARSDDGAPESEELLAPGIDEAPLATAPVTLVGGGATKFDLRGGGGHPLAPATQFSRVTIMRVVSGRVSANIASPSPYDDYLRYPASTPIDT
jgi:hypothetical protein